VAGVRTKLGSDVPIGDHKNRGEILIRVTGKGQAVTVTGFYRGKERLSVRDTAPDRITGGVRAGVIGMGLGRYRWGLDDWVAARAAAAVNQ